MAIPTGEWYWTTNEERFDGEPFGSRELAAAEAAHALEPGYRFYTAQKAVPELRQIAREALSGFLEECGIAAYEMAGEVAEEWPTLGEKQEEGLIEAMAGVAAGFLVEHNSPGWWLAIDVEQHEVGAA